MAYTDHVRESQPIVARCAVITLSDTRTTETDKSGRRIREMLEAERHHLARYEVIPDDMSRLQAQLTDLLSLHDLDVVLTNGGTGISRRDTTIEVVETYL